MDSSSKAGPLSGAQNYEVDYSTTGDEPPTGNPGASSSNTISSSQPFSIQSQTLPNEGQRKSYQYSFPLPFTSQYPPSTTTFYNYNGNVVTKSDPLMAEDQTKPAATPAKKRSKPLSKEDRPHACTFDGCKWAFSRISDLRRHEKSHAAPIYNCPYYRNDPTCHRNGGAFNRLDVLKRHLKLVHYVRDKHQNFIKSDSGWCRSCQRMFPSSKTFIVHCLECAQSSAPTEWKIHSFQEKKDSESDDNEEIHAPDKQSNKDKDKDKDNIDASLIDYDKLNESHYLESVASKATNESITKRQKTQ